MGPKKYWLPKEDIRVWGPDLGVLITKSPFQAPGDATVVGVPFSKGDGFYMVLVLPKEGQSKFMNKFIMKTLFYLRASFEGPSELLDSRSADALMSVVSRPDDLSREVVELTLPKFNVTMGNELTGLLSSIPGLSSAFVRTADYSRMTDKPVKVSSVNHKVSFSNFFFD